MPPRLLEKFRSRPARIAVVVFFAVAAFVGVDARFHEECIGAAQTTDASRRRFDTLNLQAADCQQ